MSQELDAYCPACEAERPFRRVASTQLHLGEKVKWRCGECDHGFVRIDGAVDTSAAA